MRHSVFIVLSLVTQICYAPPVSQTKKEGNVEESEINGLEDYMEYHRYLKEIVNALESDPEFRQKLEKADESDIKSGKIADELELVSHHVRTRLDEIKRVELERLKELTAQKRKLEDPSNFIDEDPLHHHVDHTNPHTFEVEDLKKLIAKTTADLAEADKKRKEQFKQYELEKEYRKQDKLNHTNGDEREKLQKELQELEEKHKKHDKLHEPGHKAQLEEVWEEQDQMQQDFDPKTFFMLHDVDGNGLWDQEEVKSLFIKELDKMYQQGAPEDDMRERYEEMERMRESVFNEMDKNRDGFIDYSEFLHQTNSNDFKQDNGWQGLDEQKQFTDEELAEYIRQHEAANQIPQGYHVPPGGYHQAPQAGNQQASQQAYNHAPQGGYQQVPPGGYQQVPQEYQQVPQGYQQPHGGQQVPQGHQQAPQGHQQAPQGDQQAPQGHQQAPQGHQQAPQGHQQAAQGHQQAPQAHQQVPPGGYQQVPHGGYQQVPHGGYQQAPHGGYQVPQGGYQVPQNGYQHISQGQNIPPAGIPHPQQVPALPKQDAVGNHQNDLNTNEVNPPQSQQQQNMQANPPPVPLQNINQAQNSQSDPHRQEQPLEQKEKLV